MRYFKEIKGWVCKEMTLITGCYLMCDQGKPAILESVVIIRLFNRIHYMDFGANSAVLECRAVRAVASSGARLSFTMSYY